jgi:hypothetical protein
LGGFFCKFFKFSNYGFFLIKIEGKFPIKNPFPNPPEKFNLKKKIKINFP